MSTRKIAGAMSFAHMAGLGAPRAEDDRKEDRKDSKRAEDDEDEERMEEDEDSGDDPKSKKGKRAEDDEDDSSAENDDTDGDGDTEKDDDKDGAKKAAFRRGRMAERKRLATIFGSKAAARNLPLACNLGFKTSMSADSVISTLRDTPAATGPTGNRSNPNLGPNGSPGASAPQQVAASWDRAFGKSPRK